jgi:hypothetical protein
MPTTPRDIVTFALKKSGVLGVGRAASAADIQDGFADMQDLLAQWTRTRWMVWDMLNIGVQSTGAMFYTAGPGGDYNVSPRPNRIASAFLRNLVSSPGNEVDTPVAVIPAREEYDRIAQKSLVSFTQCVFLETSYPLAKVRPYPVPSANIYSLFLSFKDVMPQITLDTDLEVFPAEYMPAMKFELARIFRQAYGKGMKPDPELSRLATRAVDVIKNGNLQIPELVMPRALVAGAPGYNILSDQF